MASKFKNITGGVEFANEELDDETEELEPENDTIEIIERNSIEEPGIKKYFFSYKEQELIDKFETKTNVDIYLKELKVIISKQIEKNPEDIIFLPDTILYDGAFEV